jgi:hypothetical protein
MRSDKEWLPPLTSRFSPLASRLSLLFFGPSQSAS